MIKRLPWLVVFIVIFCSQCLPPEEEKITTITYDINDPELRKILDFQDAFQSDSLVSYFRHNNPTYRYAAAMAFASHQDSTVLDSLVTLLNDEVEGVSVAAAYAIGQIGSSMGEHALVTAFQGEDSTSTPLRFNRAVLEAIGKCGGDIYLDALSTISTYYPTDTLLLEGQAYGIYRYGTRGKIKPAGTRRMLEFVSDLKYPTSVRFIAANYLSRFNKLKLDTSAQQLVPAFNRETDPRIRMALAIAVGKTKDPAAFAALGAALQTETNELIKYNILRALGNFPYAQVQPLAIKALDDKNNTVALGAARFFLDYGQSFDGTFYSRKSRDTLLNWQVQTMLQKAANRHVPPSFEATKGNINLNLKRRFGTSENPYERAATIDALGEFGWNYRFIYEQGYADEAAVVRSTSVGTLGRIVTNPRFDAFFGLSRNRIKKEIGTYLLEAVKSGDVGMVAEAANVLANPAPNFSVIFADSINILQKAIQSLEMPGAIETKYALQNAIAQLSNQPKARLVPPAPSNAGIDWTVLDQLSTEAVAELMTSKGLIVIDLLPELAPGSVANFVKLAKEGFYNGKNIHRVVPNFVIQGGCTRGDGYGGLNYTIRSELPEAYYDEEGYVGMASAGKHTECTQWFITHSPTPHLDGKYSIFGKVMSGMDVVRGSEIGDKIERIIIK